MKNISISILVCLVASIAVAEEEKEGAKVEPNTRPAGEVVLKFERKIEIPEIKRFSEDGVLEIFPGDVVHLEFQEVDGKLVNPQVVAKVSNPKRTITFKVTQDESITMLSRTSEIQQTVALDCAHRELGSEGFTPTNLRPTEKGLGSYDSWSNTVWMFRLSNIEVTSKSASEVYEGKISIRQDEENESSEQDDADQPAADSESNPEGDSNP